MSADTTRHPGVRRNWSIAQPTARPVRAPMRTSTTAEDSLNPTWQELTILIVSFLLGTAIYISSSEQYIFANTALPICIIIAMAYGNYVMVVRRVATILTPSFGFRTAVLFYGGVGSLVPLWGGDAELEFMLAFYAFNEFELLKYNLVITLFTIVFVATGPLARAVVARAVAPRENGRTSIEPSNLSLFVIGLAFLVTGSVFHFAFVLPSQFGLVGRTFPVILYQVAASAQIGLFLMLVWALRNRSPLAYPVIGLGLAYVFLGIVTFNKADTILPLIMIVAAFVYVRPNLRTLAIGATVIVIVFQAIQPVTAYGRYRVAQTYGDITAPAGLGERVSILSDYLETPDEEFQADLNYALVRFSYVNVGTLVISRYDAQQPGNSYASAYAIFIPRFLWPDKPVLTQGARDLNFEATGNDQSSVTSGLAPEGYWNGGWIGVILAALASGAVFWLWSLYALRVQEAGAWHLFPVVLLGMRAGTRFDGWFVVDVLGPLLFAVVGHFLLTFANRLIHRLRGGSG